MQVPVLGSVFFTFPASVTCTTWAVVRDSRLTSEDELNFLQEAHHSLYISFMPRGVRTQKENIRQIPYQEKAEFSEGRTKRRAFHPACDFNFHLVFYQKIAKAIQIHRIPLQTPLPYACKPLVRFQFSTMKDTRGDVIDPSRSITTTVYEVSLNVVLCKTCRSACEVNVICDLKKALKISVLSLQLCAVLPREQ